MKIHPIFTPVVPVGDQIKLPAFQRMERMCHEKCLCAIGVPDLKIGQTGIVQRLKKLKFHVQVMPWHKVDPDRVELVDVIFLPTQWAEQITKYKHFESKKEAFHAFIKRGGGLLVCQPNPASDQDSVCTPSLLPYPITFKNWYDKNLQRINLDPSHFITDDLPGKDMPFPADPIIEIDRRYKILAKQKSTGWPSLAVCHFGKGRVVVQTANENYIADQPLTDEILRRMIVWVSRRDRLSAEKTGSCLVGGSGSSVSFAQQPEATGYVSAVLKKIDAGNRKEKLAALQKLRSAANSNQLGGQKNKAIKLCARVMRSNDADVAAAACDVLSSLDAEAVPMLVKALQAKEPATQSRAARALSSIASRHKAQLHKIQIAIPHLAKLLHAGPKSGQHNAFYAITEMGPRAIPHMIGALDAKDYFQWVMMRGFVRHAKESVLPLCVALRKDNVKVRRNAGFMLFHISWRARHALPLLESKALGLLTAAIQDKDKRVRGWAIKTLGRMEGRGKPALDEIIAALKQPDAPLREIAGAARRIGPQLKHLDALFEAAHRMAGRATSQNDRESAVGLFGRAIGAIGDNGVNRIVRALDDRRKTVRKTAMYALFTLGSTLR